MMNVFARRLKNNNLRKNKCEKNNEKVKTKKSANRMICAFLTEPLTINSALYLEKTYLATTGKQG